MNNLQIALQDGFENDSVIILVNGRERYNKSGVTTNRVISLADTVTCSVDTLSAVIQVDVTSKNIRGNRDVLVSEFPFVAVGVGKGNVVEIIPSKESFRYC